jgi:transketolase
VIIGKTFKGRNYGPEVENNFDYHGKPLGDKAESAVEHLKTLIINHDAKLIPQSPFVEGYVPKQNAELTLTHTHYDKGYYYKYLINL